MLQRFSMFSALVAGASATLSSFSNGNFGSLSGEDALYDRSAAFSPIEFRALSTRLETALHKLDENPTKREIVEECRKELFGILLSWQMREWELRIKAASNNEIFENTAAANEIKVNIADLQQGIKMLENKLRDVPIGFELKTFPDMDNTALSKATNFPSNDSEQQFFSKEEPDLKEKLSCRINSLTSKERIVTYRYFAAMYAYSSREFDFVLAYNSDFKIEMLVPEKMPVQTPVEKTYVNYDTAENKLYLNKEVFQNKVEQKYTLLLAHEMRHAYWSLLHKYLPADSASALRVYPFYPVNKEKQEQFAKNFAAGIGRVKQLKNLYDRKRTNEKLQQHEEELLKKLQSDTRKIYTPTATFPVTDGMLRKTGKIKLNQKINLDHYGTNYGDMIIKGIEEKENHTVLTVDFADKTECFLLTLLNIADWAFEVNSQEADIRFYAEADAYIHQFCPLPLCKTIFKELFAEQEEVYNLAKKYFSTPTQTPPPPKNTYLF